MKQTYLNLSGENGNNQKEVLCQHGKQKQNGKGIWPKAADG
jgi:hypothetical protein